MAVLKSGTSVNGDLAASGNITASKTKSWTFIAEIDELDQSNTISYTNSSFANISNYRYLKISVNISSAYSSWAQKSLYPYFYSGTLYLDMSLCSDGNTVGAVLLNPQDVAVSNAAGYKVCAQFYHSTTPNNIGIMISTPDGYFYAPISYIEGSNDL